MTEPSGGQRPASGQRDTRPSAESWEQRTAGLASEIQRWLIRTSARNMRDELGGQVKKAFRGSERNSGDSWATATTEPPHAADEAPECAWCPVCRAARRLTQARAESDTRGGGPRISDAADVMAGAVRDALAGIDSILSYRPSGTPAPEAPSGPSDPSAPAAPAAPARPEPPAAASDVMPPEAKRANEPTESG